MHSWQIKINGQIQGIGFRPYIYRLAKEAGLMGEVRNAPDGVTIHFNAGPETARNFYHRVTSQPPALAVYTSHSLTQTERKKFDRFSIEESSTRGACKLQITPDLSVCDECRQELHDPGNRRYRYPFITCTQCGPRYSIIKSLPYDRDKTTMAPFAMCSACYAEYTDPESRRYHSQTNSCPNCPVTLYYKAYEADEITTAPSEITDRIVKAWRAGKVVAIKGIGGYLLTCDAGNAGVINKLRARKHRPHKPLAVMYPNIQRVEEELLVSPAEKELLQGLIAPIVILQLRREKHPALALPAIAPGLAQVGAMLPYTPLFELLLQQYQKPVVATSGNLSGAPILFKDEEAIAQLKGVADIIVWHDREIVTPLDDSVARVAKNDQVIWLRRSRGLAPAFLRNDTSLPRKDILATGAHLKSSYAFALQDAVFTSQYFGNLSNFDALQNMQASLHHMWQVYDRQPELVLTDLHPDYASTRLAAEIAATYNIPVLPYQHHKAHFAAVLAENELLDQNERVLGVIWDGTGLGEDWQIWGSEFFLYEQGRMQHVNSFDYARVLSGDKMSREPRLSALSMAHDIPEAEPLLRQKFSKQEWGLYKQLLSGESKMRTRGMGRIFDAVASLTGLLDRATYEGQAAMLLESAASEWYLGNPADPGHYLQDVWIRDSISTSDLIRSIIGDVLSGKAPGMIAAKFHLTLVEIITAVAEKESAEKVSCSGGVFQNALLVNLLCQKLARKRTVYFHKHLSPNDENISFGQMMLNSIWNNSRTTKEERFLISLKVSS